MCDKCDKTVAECEAAGDLYYGVSDGVAVVRVLKDGRVRLDPAAEADPDQVGAMLASVAGSYAAETVRAATLEARRQTLLMCLGALSAAVVRAGGSVPADTLPASFGQAGPKGGAKA